MELKTRTVKDLAEMAKKKGVLGWHSMRKDQLIQALIKRAKTNGTQASNGINGSKRSRSSVLKKTNGVVHSGKNGHSPAKSSGVVQKSRSSRLERRLKQIQAKLARSRDLAFRGDAESDQTVTRDRLVVMVRDPFWLQAYWELSRASIERARVAMGQNWHAARPVLCLHEIHSDGANLGAHCVVRHIEVHGGVNTWYVDVKDPPKTYQMEIGYQAPGGKFYSLARSNVVSTPQSAPSGAFDRNWAGVAHDCDHIYALSGGFSGDNHSEELREVFEEQLHRPMGLPLGTRFGLKTNGDGEADKETNFNFGVDAELVVFGATEPGSRVTLRGEPIRVESDGSFVMRLHMPDRRQVLPLIACSADGAEQRTIVLAVERNTKVMEPVVREQAD
jgi:hypothetical protein